MTEKAHTISESIIENMSLTWKMFEDVFKRIPDSQWRTGENDYLIPARLMLLTIETIDFYSSISPDNYEHNYRFRIDTDRVAPELLPNKRQLITYLR